MGADPNYADSDKRNTSLHVAAKEGQSLQVELLWIFGVDFAQRNADGKTAAAVARSEDNVKFFFNFFYKYLKFLV